MSRKRKARPDAATSRRAEQENHQTSGISQNDFSIHTGPVSRYLLRGQENAVPLRQLMAITGIDGRSIREKIAAERLAGVPILSDNSTGYFLPGNNGERERFVRSMRHRAKEIERAAEAIERSKQQ